MGIQYCNHCKNDCGSWPCKKGHSIIRNVPNDCKDFNGELYVPQKRKVNVPVYGTENYYDGLTVYEICNTFNTDWQDHVVKTFKVNGNTLKECFEKAYPTERSLRYCSGYCIRFKDPDIHKKYLEWKKTGVTIEMYYGGGVVD